MLIVYQSYFKVKDSNNLDEGLFDIVRCKIIRFITIAGISTRPQLIDWIFGARSYSLRIVYTTPARAQVAWSENNRVTLRLVSFTLNQLSEILHKMILHLDRIIRSLTFKEDNVQQPEVDWLGLYNNIGNDQVAFSFIQNRRNKYLQNLNT